MSPCPLSPGTEAPKPPPKRRLDTPLHDGDAVPQRQGDALGPRPDAAAAWRRETPAVFTSAEGGWSSLRVTKRKLSQKHCFLFTSFTATCRNRCFFLTSFAIMMLTITLTWISSWRGFNLVDGWNIHAQIPLCLDRIISGCLSTMPTAVKAESWIWPADSRFEGTPNTYKCAF